MRIIYIHKADFHKRPPVISAVFILAELGYKIDLITCGISADLHERLLLKGVGVHIIKQNKRWLKIFDYYLFQRKVSKIIIKSKTSHSDLLLWIEGAQTIVSLFNRIKKLSYILQIQELHEKSKVQKYVISKTIQKAKVVFMPEYNRTVIYQVWFDLKIRPTVLPNKPYFLPNENEMEKLRTKYKNYVDQFRNKKVILYQGGISSVRMLENLTMALNKLNDHFVLLLVGKEQESGYIDKLKGIYSSIVHIPLLPAPDYLVFTSIAYIGYVCYAPTSLNNVYCAPNKINEYSAFSLPMIGNDIPGLRIIESCKTGVVINDNDINSIVKGIIEIDNNYIFYKNNARNIFEKIDNKTTIAKALTKIYI